MNAAFQEEIMFAELFDAFPESVILFKPIESPNNEVCDFEIAYCNNALCDFLKAAKHALLGQSVLSNSLVDDAYKTELFKKCLTVWQTGKQQQEVEFNDFLGKRFTSLCSKIKEGVISVARDNTASYDSEKTNKQRLAQFTNILDASADGVMILEAIRNEENEVADFRLTHCNQAAFDVAQLGQDSVGKTLLEILPHLNGSIQLDLHKNVLATGQPQRIETTFRNEKGEEYGWFIVSLMKAGDTVISTFIDVSDKKKNEEKIEEQAQLLESIFESSVSGIFAAEAIRNANGEIEDLQLLKINKAFTQLIGIPAEVAEGARYNTLFPAGKKHGMLALYSSVIQTGESFRKELFYQSDKITGWYDVSAVKRGNNGIVVNFTNVTESKTNKQALEEGSKYLQEVINSAQTGILLLSPSKNDDGVISDFIFKTVNHSAATMVGEEPCKLIGKKHNEVFTESLANGLFQRYKEIAEGSAIKQRFEIHYIGDGIDAWLDIMVKKRNEDLLITLHDFSPLKKLEVEISETAQKLNAVVNTATAGMFTLHPVFGADSEIEDFRFSLVNQAVAGYIGQQAETLKGSLGSVYFSAYKTNGLFDIYKDTYLNHKEHQFDFHYEDGYDVYFNIHTVSAGDEVLVTFTDQTSLKKMQAQLEASIEELKKSNSSLEEFAYAASHDLQEPLRKINYFSERLRKGIGQKLSDDETRMFERMENAASRMSQLINDLLTYSQVSRNSRPFDTINLNDVIQQVVNDLETTIAEKKATITLENLPAIDGDKVQLTQLFQNILSNSLKYSKKDISPVISIKCDTISNEINGTAKSFYQISISDNGIGFEQEHAERIFKVFQRLHGQSEFPGTGIGLAIVQKVVENHHGSISAEGWPEKGSTFTILLPQG